MAAPAKRPLVDAKFKQLAGRRALRLSFQKFVCSGGVSWTLVLIRATQCPRSSAQRPSAQEQPLPLGWALNPHGKP